MIVPVSRWSTTPVVWTTVVISGCSKTWIHSTRTSYLCSKTRQMTLCARSGKMVCCIVGVLTLLFAIQIEDVLCKLRKWMANYFVLKQCQILSIYDCYNFSINAMCLVIINSEQIIWKLIAVTQVHVYMICLNKTYAVDHWIKRIYRFYQTFLILLILWLTFLFSLIIIKVELSLNTEQLVDCSIDVLVCDTYICLECVWM